MAANIFTGATNANWGTATNWSLAAVPLAGDGNVATFNVTSPNCTVDASNKVCNGIDFTGYTNTITMTFNITVSGNITLDPGMTIAGTGAMSVNAASTLTSNGETWPNAFSFLGSFTHTLADNWDIDGLLTIGGSPGNSNTVVNGAFTISAGAGFTIGTSASVTGTATVLLNGTGTVTGSGSFANNFTINTAGTITFLNGGTFVYRTGTWTYTAGTVVTTSANLTINLGCTLDISGITWAGNVLVSANGTVTLTSPLNVTGLLSLGATTANVTFATSQVNASGGLRYAGTTGIIAGTQINLLGTGTVDAPSGTTGRIENAIAINAPGGTITFDATTTPYLKLSNLTLTAFAAIVIDGTTLTTGGGAAPAGSLRTNFATQRTSFH